MQSKKLYQSSVLWLCCTLLWCVVIFCFSAQDATASTAVSDGVLHKIAEICKSNNITEADYRKNFKSATSDNASLEDYIVYMMKYEYFYDLVEKTLVKK